MTARSSQWRSRFTSTPPIGVYHMNGNQLVEMILELPPEQRKLPVRIPTESMFAGYDEATKLSAGDDCLYIESEAE